MSSAYILFLVCFNFSEGYVVETSEEVMPNVEETYLKIESLESGEAIGTEDRPRNDVEEEETTDAAAVNKGQMQAVGKIIICAKCGYIPVLPITIYQPKIINAIPIFVTQAPKDSDFDNIVIWGDGNTDRPILIDSNERSIEATDNTHQDNMSFRGYVPASGKIVIAAKF